MLHTTTAAAVTILQCNVVNKRLKCPKRQVTVCRTLQSSEELQEEGGILTCSEDLHRWNQAEVLRPALPKNSGSNRKCLVTNDGKTHAMDNDDDAANHRHRVHRQMEFISEIGGCQSTQTFVSKNGQPEVDSLQSFQPADWRVQLFISRRQVDSRVSALITDWSRCTTWNYYDPEMTSESNVIYTTKSICHAYCHTAATPLVDHAQRPYDGGVRGVRSGSSLRGQPLPMQRAHERTFRLTAATFIAVRSGGGWGAQVITPQCCNLMQM